MLDDMATPDILQIIRDAAPTFEDAGAYRVCNVIVALVRSLTKEQLAEVNSELQQMDGIPYDITSLVKWLLNQKPKAPAEINEPIVDLIRWYNDKKSKKVEYARVRLMRRFDGQSYAHQYAILKSFLAGDKKACDWAARHLWDHWIPTLQGAIVHRWETSPTETLAMVVIKHVPVEYVMKHQDTLCQYAEYKYLCCRLFGAEGFTLDESRLDVPDLFFIMGRLGRIDQIPHLRIRLAEYLETHQEIDANTLYWMGGLGMTEDLIELYHRFTNTK